MAKNFLKLRVKFKKFMTRESRIKIDSKETKALSIINNAIKDRNVRLDVNPKNGRRIIQLNDLFIVIENKTACIYNNSCYIIHFNEINMNKIIDMFDDKVDRILSENENYFKLISDKNFNNLFSSKSESNNI